VGAASFFTIYERPAVETFNFDPFCQLLWNLFRLSLVAGTPLSQFWENRHDFALVRWLRCQPINKKMVMYFVFKARSRVQFPFRGPVFKAIARLSRLIYAALVHQIHNLQVEASADYIRRWTNFHKSFVADRSIRHDVRCTVLSFLMHHKTSST
jgi:hypothetical protein